MAPGAFAQRENERVDNAHGRDADAACERKAVARVLGPAVVVHHAVVDEGDEPDQDVENGIHEHEAELAVDADALLG